MKVLTDGQSNERTENLRISIPLMPSTAKRKHKTLGVHCIRKTKKYVHGYLSNCVGPTTKTSAEYVHLPLLFNVFSCPNSTTNCFSKQNSKPIGCRVMATNNFQYSSRPPSWILKMLFGHVTHRVPNMLFYTKFHRNLMIFAARCDA